MLDKTDISPSVNSAGVLDAGELSGGALEIRRLTDAETIRATLTEKRMASIVCPDGVDPAEVADGLIEDPTALFLGVYVGGVYSGFLLAHKTFGAIMVHSCLLPRAYGRKAIIAGREAIERFWDYYGGDWMVAHVPAFNRVALKFVDALGFKIGKVLPDAWQRNGRRYDSILLEKVRV